MKPLCIGLTGKARSGKSTVAAALERIGMRRTSFADGLRRCVAAALCDGEPQRGLDGCLTEPVPWFLCEGKDEPLPPEAQMTLATKDVLPYTFCVHALFARHDGPSCRPPSRSAHELNEGLDSDWPRLRDSIQTGRRLLQVLGTDVARRFLGDDIWIRRWEAEHPVLTRPWVWDDVRFANEAEYVRSRGGIVVRLVRADDESTDEHASERLEFSADLSFRSGCGDVGALVGGVMAAISGRLQADAQAALDGGGEGE